MAKNLLVYVGGILLTTFFNAYVGIKTIVTFPISFLRHRKKDQLNNSIGKTLEDSYYPSKNIISK